MTKTVYGLLRAAISACLLTTSIAVHASTCVEYRSQYGILDGSVWFSASTPAIKRRVEGMDVLSFRLVHAPGYADGYCAKFKNDYAADSRGVYFRGEHIKGANPHTFRVLADGYAVDNFAVYGNATRITTRVSEFRIIDAFATDGISVFYKDRMLKGTDLEPIPGARQPALIYRTSAAVYDAEGHQIDADHLTISEFIPQWGIARDKNKVFYRAREIAGADPVTFENIGNYLFRDKRAVYLEGREIVGLDPATVRQFRLQGLYTTDGKAVFKRYTRMDRDAATFDADLQSFYTKDKNGVYYNDVRIHDADPQTFEATSLDRAKDKNYQYQGNEILCALRDGLKPNILLCKLPHLCRSSPRTSLY